MIAGLVYLLLDGVFVGIWIVFINAGSVDRVGIESVAHFIEVIVCCGHCNSIGINTKQPVSVLRFLLWWWNIQEEIGLSEVVCGLERV